MPHKIEYRGVANDVTWETAKQVATDLAAWVDGDSNRRFERIKYDRSNTYLSVVISITDVSDLNTKMSELDSGVDNLNTDHSTGFPMPSHKASINSYEPDSK